MPDDLKGSLDELDALTKEAEAKHCLKGTHAMADCIIVGYEPLLQSLRAAVEKMEEEVMIKSDAADLDSIGREKAERERDELKRRLEGAHVFHCVCDPQDKISLDPRCLTLREEKK